MFDAEADVMVDDENDINPFLQDLDAVSELTKDLQNATKLLSAREVRYLVGLYYQCQAYRIATGNQNISLKKSAEPHALIEWALGNFKTLEHNIVRVMDKYTKTTLAGRWQRSITGIGPVIAAGFIGHFDVKKAPTAGHFWRYAGLDPSIEWIGKKGAEDLVARIVGTGRTAITAEHIAQCATATNRNPRTLLTQVKDDKGKITRASLTSALSKRPWNPELKTLCWKVGESFVKVKNNSNDFYGKIYAIRKEKEAKWNDEGKYAEQAAAKMRKFNITAEPTRSIYLSGKLPPAHLHERAKRYAVKLYVSHLHHVMHLEEIGFLPPPPRPYIVEHGGHTHIIPVPDPAGILPKAE